MYELMEIEGSRGEDKEEDTEGGVVVVREDDRLGLLREISSNPRLENNVRLRTLSLGPQNCPLINLLTILILGLTQANLIYTYSYTQVQPHPGQPDSVQAPRLRPLLPVAHGEDPQRLLHPQQRGHDQDEESNNRHSGQLKDKLNFGKIEK